MPEERQNEQPEKKETPRVKKVVGNVKLPDNPETGRHRKPTYEHG